MASFIRQRKYVTQASSMVVDGGLDPGTYTFQLQVTDQNGSLSKPTRVKVEIVRNLVIGPITRPPTGPGSRLPGGGSITGILRPGGNG
jgi:hypothetical protein